MAFNKISMVLLILLIAAAIIVDARISRIDILKASKASKSKYSWSDCCRNCIEDRPGAFYCIDLKDGNCPDTCKDCYCPSNDPLRCGCLDAIDACPSKCDTNFESPLVTMKRHVN